MFSYQIFIFSSWEMHFTALTLRIRNYNFFLLLSGKNQLSKKLTAIFQRLPTVFSTYMSIKTQTLQKQFFAQNYQQLPPVGEGWGEVIKQILCRFSLKLQRRRKSSVRTDLKSSLNDCHAGAV